MNSAMNRPVPLCPEVQSELLCYPLPGCKVLLSACLSVCMSVHKHISEITIFEFDILCTFGFLNVIIILQ